ncbi:polysaccharide lyase family 8 super-sandwich domain-containing protein [Arachidicoccus soli]|uniref:Chondroitin lyase n=1 Tax=Arachidicoccus soli TaxID=2341117 RepID=A0A386HSP7_9BACT|nr:polysaccharide lyase family 8 super-sandwich domain-containing protein [Arachidicoccus soli]AYD48430.1 chondroitin lyase [Arachidicoccus soli]
MKEVKIIICCLYFLLVFNQAWSRPVSVYDSIMNAVRKEQVSGVTDFAELNAAVDSYLNSAIFEVARGKWLDVNYRETVRTNPSWANALRRIKDMSLAYTINNPENSYYQSPTLFAAINKSLDYFCTCNPVPYSTNWYSQGVSRPQILALILINMRYGLVKLNSAVEKKAIDVMCRDTAYNSRGRNNPLQRVNQGANRSLIAMDWLYIGSLIKSDYMLRIGTEESYSPIKYTRGEGIQQDLSYNMHYGYLYTGGYGSVFMSSVIESAFYTAGTRYAIKGSMLGLFRRFVLESVLGTIRGHWIDWNVIGRGISRIGTLNRDYTSLLKKMQLIDADSAYLYNPVIARMNGSRPPSYGIVPAHRYYWKTDYTLHLRPAFTFAIHAISSRTLSTEIGNNENLKGFWAAEGATDIQTVGDEYYNIFPLWNWTHIPGTTLPDSLPSTNGGKAPGGGDRKGTSAFAGGVSDSLYGVTTFEMNNDVLTSAKKSWFQFDDEVVCLGAGISSTATQPVNTTVNQTLLRDNSVLVSSRDNVSRLDNGVHLHYKNNLDWVVQDGVGYVFPNGGNIDLLTENRRGNWLGISKAGSLSSHNVESENIFQLTIAHGIHPSNDKYAYIVVPGKKTATDMIDYLSKNNISIGINSDSVQAVYHRGLRIWQMVFYKGNAFYNNDSIRIWTNIPSTIMIKRIGNTLYKIYVADPSQTASSISVFAELSGIPGTRVVCVTLPSGNFAGQSVMTTISDSSNKYVDADNR